MVIFSIVAGLFIGFGSGWKVHSWKCEAQAAEVREDLAAHAEAQRQLKDLTESKQDAVTEQSTQRLDEHQAAQQKETVYVEKQVIQYRDRWRDRPCDRPADWVRIYNESLFGSSNGSVLETR